MITRKTVRTPAVEFARKGSAATEDGELVRRKGVIFRAGVFPEKSYAMTPDELREMAAGFSPVPIDLGHPSSASPLDGKFGHLEAVELSDDGTTLYGTASFPKWFDELLGDARRKVSASWDRTTKRLRSLSLVTHPHIEEAELQAAFACACGHEEAEETRTTREERPMTKREQDIAALQAMSDEEYDAVDAEIDAYDDDPGDEPDDEDTDSGPSPAEFAALQRIEELEAKDRRRDAEVFADAAIAANFALPAERADLIEDHVQAAVDDGNAPADFSAGRKVKTRVAAFEARVRSRTPHALGQERIANFSGGRVLDNGGDRPETDAEYAARIVAKYNGRNKITR